jgi:hypothetical protein
MYSSCIFCSAGLGRNEAIEHFPVGRSLAFDAGRGRLWATCPRCARWNLAPIEERWEAVESAEKLFRDSRMRVQSESIGLAKLPDGTRLIRVGEALAGELAAWRYGSQLVSRRNRYYLGVGLAAGLGIAAAGGMWAVGALGAAGGFVNMGRMVWERRLSGRLIHHLDAEQSPTGEPLGLRRWQLQGARLSYAAGGPVLDLPEGRLPEPGREKDAEAWRLTIRGEAADAVLSRTMVLANRKGAGRKDVGAALDLLSQAGSAEAYLERAARREAALGVPRLQFVGRKPPSSGVGLREGWRRFAGTFRGEIMPIQRVHAAHMSVAGPRSWHPDAKRLAAEEKRNRLQRPEALALEMALNDEAERRAMRGELAALERAWREAEEIAHIADQLPHDPLERLAGAAPEAG